MGETQIHLRGAKIDMDGGCSLRRTIAQLLHNYCNARTTALVRARVGGTMSEVEHGSQPKGAKTRNYCMRNRSRVNYCSLKIMGNPNYCIAIVNYCIAIVNYCIAIVNYCIAIV